MTPLQKLQSKVAWAINFKLQFFHCGELSYTLEMSRETEQLISKHANVVRQLKKSLRVDYELQRAKILEERERTAKLFDIPAN